MHESARTNIDTPIPLLKGKGRRREWRRRIRRREGVENGR